MVSNGTDAVLVEDTFPFNPKSDQPEFKVTVTCLGVGCTPVELDGRGSKILGRKTPKPVTLSMDDVVGCRIKDKDKVDATCSRLDIIAYPHHKLFASKKTQRRREVVTLTFKKHDSYEENVRMAKDWRTLIHSLAKGHGFQQAQDNKNSEGTPSSSKVLVLVNPFGGTGKALKMFLEKVVPVFTDANIEYEMISTERQGHAKEMMMKLTLTDYYGIIIVSGDGLVYEVVNGLMARDDWETAIKTPLGVIPGGSGNALCSAISHHAGEPFLSEPVLPASFIITKHRPLPMDLVAVDTAEGRLYSFLNVCWGIIADIDIESEKYRSLGSARFTLGTISRLLGLRRYRGRVSFLPVGEYHPKEATGSMKRSKSEVAPSSKSTKNVKKSQSLDMTTTETQHRADTSGEPELDKADNDDDAKVNSGHVITESGDAVNGSDDASPCAAVNGSDATDDVLPRVNGCSDDSSELPGLSEPVPSSWVTIEDDFVLVLAMYQTHLNSELIPAPACTFDDGLMHLIVVRASITRTRILRVLLAFQEGREVNDDAAEVVCVKAFRLEPLTDRGVLTVDGETVKHGAIQAHVLPGVARIMALDKSHV